MYWCVYRIKKHYPKEYAATFGEQLVTTGCASVFLKQDPKVDVDEELQV